MRVERVKGPLHVDTVRDLTQGARLGGILIICNILLTNSCLIYINMIILTFLIFECVLFIFQRGNQKVSLLSKILLSGTWLFAAVALVVTICHKITWLTYLYYFSYIKIGVTLIKYIPQVNTEYEKDLSKCDFSFFLFFFLACQYFLNLLIQI